MKGKNFSCNNLGQRKKSDFYQTPYIKWIDNNKYILKKGDMI